MANFDHIFKGTGADSDLSNRLNRVEGAIPMKRRGAYVFTASAVRAPESGAIVDAGAGTGKISSVTGIKTQGNAFPFVVSGNFNFSATATAITIYWDGTHQSAIFVIKRADGSNFTIPAGSLILNGLKGGTLYGFYPYLNLSSPTTVSFSLGDAGAPAFAMSPAASAQRMNTAAQQQSLSSNEAITSGPIYWTTPTTGTSTGSGTGRTASSPPPYRGRLPIVSADGPS